MGVETLPPILQGSVAPLEHASPFESEVRPGIEPGLRPYHRRVLPQHLQTLSLSDRGWGIEPSIFWLSPRRLRRWTTRSFCQVVETGVEPAKSQASHACRFACLRTRPWTVADPGVAPGGPGL